MLLSLRTQTHRLSKHHACCAAVKPLNAMFVLASVEEGLNLPGLSEAWLDRARSTSAMRSVRLCNISSINERGQDISHYDQLQLQQGHGLLQLPLQLLPLPLQQQLQLQASYEHTFVQAQQHATQRYRQPYHHLQQEAYKQANLQVCAELQHQQMQQQQHEQQRKDENPESSTMDWDMSQAPTRVPARLQVTTTTTNGEPHQLDAAQLTHNRPIARSLLPSMTPAADTETAATTAGLAHMVTSTLHGAVPSPTDGVVRAAAQGRLNTVVAAAVRKPFSNWLAPRPVPCNAAREVTEAPETETMAQPPGLPAPKHTPIVFVRRTAVANANSSGLQTGAGVQQQPQQQQGCASAQPQRAQLNSFQARSGMPGQVCVIPSASGLP